jgi:hypothetical protein
MNANFHPQLCLFAETSLSSYAYILSYLYPFKAFMCTRN